KGVFNACYDATSHKLFGQILLAQSISICKHNDDENRPVHFKIGPLEY
ncbi:15479_t:CDS:1, partial [Funneliformis mosseae]